MTYLGSTFTGRALRDPVCSFSPSLKEFSMSHAISQTTKPARTSQWAIAIALVVAGVVVVSVQLARSLSSAQPSPAHSSSAAQSGSDKPLAPEAPDRIYRDPAGPGRRF